MAYESVPTKTEADGSSHAQIDGSWEELDPPGTYRDEHHDAVSALLYASLIHERDPGTAADASRRAIERATRTGQVRAVANDTLTLLDELARAGGASAADIDRARHYVRACAVEGSAPSDS